MKYTALRPVKFDREYEVGEEIPGEVVDSCAVKRLIDAGKIAPTPGPSVHALGSMEDGIAFVEGILGIIPEEGHNLDQRAEACKAALSDIQAVQEEPIGGTEEVPVDPFLKSEPREERIAAAETLLGIEPKPDGTLDERIDACLDAFADMLAADTITTPPASENTQEDDADGTQEATPHSPAVNTVNMTTGTTDPSTICPVCMRVMGSKAALTTHLRREHPEYKI